LSGYLTTQIKDVSSFLELIERSQNPITGTKNRQEVLQSLLFELKENRSLIDTAKGSNKAKLTQHLEQKGQSISEEIEELTVRRQETYNKIKETKIALSDPDYRKNQVLVNYFSATIGSLA